jgi:hypothetical protein
MLFLHHKHPTALKFGDCTNRLLLHYRRWLRGGSTGSCFQFVKSFNHSSFFNTNIKYLLLNPSTINDRKRKNNLPGLDK